MSDLRYLCLLRIVVSNTYCVVFFSFWCLRLVSMLPVSLDCPCLNVLLLLRHSLTFNKYKHSFYFCKKKQI
jgi:hypothetical protein